MSETGSETKSEDGVESNENNPNETVCSAGSEENYINQDRQPDQENPQDPQENPDSIHAEEDPVIQEEPCVEEAEEKNTETEDVIIGQEDIKSGEETRNQAKEPELGSDLESYSEPEKTEELPLNSDSQEKSHTPVPDPPTMDEIATSELESLKLSGSETSPLEHRIIQNNENETVEEPKQFTPTPQAPVKKTPAKSGIRPPSAVLRNPKVPSLPRPATTTPSTPRAISTPRQTASTAPSPRPLSRMPRERSDVQNRHPLEALTTSESSHQSEVPISRPTVIQVTSRPKMAATMLDKKNLNKRRSISQRSSSSSLLHSKQYPGAIYPLSPDFIFNC
uniref:Extensin-like n=1 Tax=Caenorhabditis tropicalis TaxID=1561998 RepID=A0A1I7UJT9_9PELO